MTFPFAISREKAISQLNLRTAGLTAHKISSTLLSYLLPSLNVDALRPFRVVPVYLPTWVIDAEVEATAWLKKAESDDHYIKIAAYPILIPGYLAQYNIDMPNPATRQNQEMTVSSFIEAHVPNGRSVIEVSPLAKEMFKFFNIPPPDLFINGQHAPLTRSFACVYKVTGRHVNNQLCRPVVEDWVNRALGRETPLQRYRDRFFGTSDSEAIRKVESQWADPRIRPFDADERNANLEWLATGSDVFILNSLLEVYNKKRDTPGEPQEVDGSDQETDDAELEWLKKQIVVAEHKREQKTPTWLAEYEIQQRLLETPESSASSNDVAPAQQADNAPQDTASDATTHADSEKPPS
ncbi:hypothetical protein ACG7TL_007057 [Trametes sanguinea]